MNFDQFDQNMRDKAAKVKAAQQSLLSKVSADGLRFVDDNFRNQSWEGKPWKKIVRDGTILVSSGGGALKRSFNDELSPGEVRIYSNVSYAQVHNEGFDGQVAIPAHKRSQYKKTGRGKKKKTSTGMVKAHTRKMKIDQRQFAPTAASPSATLQQQVNQTIQTHFKDILNP
jgi:phage gpG-like protein